MMSRVLGAVLLIGVLAGGASGQPKSEAEAPLAPEAVLAQAEAKYVEADIKGALALALEALCLSTEQHGEGSPTTTRAFVRVVDMQLMLASLDEAHALCKERLQGREAALGADHPDLASYLIALGKVLIDRGRPLEARPVLERAERLCAKLPDSDPRVADCCQAMGELCRLVGTEDRSAGPYFRRALRLREAAKQPVLSAVAESLLGCARTARSWEERKELVERSRIACEKALGSDHPGLINPLLAGSYPSKQRALGIAKTALGPDHPRVADCLVAVARDQLWRHPSTEPMLLEAVAIYERASHEQHPKYGWALFTLAGFYVRKDLDKAWDLSLKALAICKRLPEDWHRLEALIQSRLSEIAAAKQDWEQAEERAREALAASERVDGHWMHRRGYHDELAKVLRQRGKHGEEAALLEDELQTARREGQTVWALDTLREITYCHMRAGNRTEGSATISRAMELALSEEFTPKTAWYSYLFALHCRELFNEAQLVALRDHMLAFHRSLSDDDAGYLDADTMDWAAGMLVEADRCDEALALVQRAYRIYTRELSTDHLRTDGLSLFRCLTKMERFPEALEAGERSVGLAQRLAWDAGPNEPRVAERIEELLEVCKRAGDERRTRLWEARLGWIRTLPVLQSPGPLSSEDMNILRNCGSWQLFDPRGATCVQAKIKRHFPKDAAPREVIAWLLPYEEGKLDGDLYLLDGTLVRERAEEVVLFDFVGACSRRYGREDPPAEGPGFAEVSDVTAAALLFWLDEVELAAAALARARGRDPDLYHMKFIRAHRLLLAGRYYDALLRAFAAGADAEARDRSHLLAELPNDGDEWEPELVALVRNAQRVGADLRRRASREGPPAERLPDDFGSWAANRRIDWLLEALEDIAAPQASLIEEDWRVKALVELDQAVVMTLLDCLELDERLTRTVRFDVDPPAVVGVRDVALVALEAILDVRAPAERGAVLSTEEAKRAAETFYEAWEKRAQTAPEPGPKEPGPNSSR